MCFKQAFFQNYKSIGLWFNSFDHIKCRDNQGHRIPAELLESLFYNMKIQGFLFVLRIWQNKYVNVCT